MDGRLPTPRDTIQTLTTSPGLVPQTPCWRRHGDSGWEDARPRSNVKPRHLRPLLTFLDQTPDLAVVIDHGAKLAIRSGRLDTWAVLPPAAPTEPWDQCGTVLHHCQTHADIRRPTRPVISPKPCQAHRPSTTLLPRASNGKTYPDIFKFF